MKKSSGAIDQASSQFLDLARWLSAIAVVFDHVNARLFDFAPGAHNPAVMLAWRFLAGFGHQAVVVFFVLSGYLVGGKIIHQSAHQSFRPAHYLIQRVTRIYLVFLPALALVALLDSAGLNAFGLPVYDAAYLRAHLSWTTLLGNVGSLQNFLVVPFGTNGPLGTLANEFWYYITFPLLIAPFNATYGGAAKWSAFLLGLGLLTWLSALQIQHGIGFVVWLIGAAAATIPVRLRLARPWPALAVFLVFVIAVRVAIRQADYTIALGTIVDFSMALLFGWLLCALRAQPWKAAGGRIVAINAALAGFSYSLYAVHVPVINFACAALKHAFGYGYGEAGQQSAELGVAAGLVVLALATAWLFSRLTEQHTQKVRQAAHRLLGL